MATQPSSFPSEDSIDLRKMLETLLRRWRLIAVTLAMSAIIGVGFSFLFQPAVYESSGSAQLPVTGPDTGLGLTPEGYLALASSGPVMESVREQLGLESSSGQLRNRFTFELPQDQTISFTASANSAEQSFLLANTWLESFQRELESQLKGQFDQIQAQAVQEIELLSPQLTNAEEELAEYDLGNDQSLSELRLSILEARLAESEHRLQELLASTLPKSEARLTSLQNLSGLETGNTGGGGTPGISEPGEVSPELSIPADVMPFQSSPEYIQLRQNLTQSQLTALEQDLVRTENRIQQLDLSSIPIAQSRLVSLEKALETEPEFLGQPGTSDNLTPNPVYLTLGQDRADTRILLDVEQGEAAALSTRVAILREQIDDLRVELLFRQEIEKTRSALAIDHREAEVLETTILELRPGISRLRADVRTEKAARQELENNAANLQAAYDLARTELDRLAKLENKLASYSRLSAVQDPTQPTSSVSPQRTRNITLGMFLGLVIGVCAALLVDYYQGRPTASPPPVPG